MTIVSSRFKVVALLFAIGWGVPSIAAAQSAEEHVVVQPGPRVGPPWLGVTLNPKSSGEGVEVEATMRRSPADGTGVAVGDRIVSVGGSPVASVADIRNAVRRHQAGEEVEVVVLRNSERRALKFKLAPMPGGEEIVRNHLLGFPAPEFTFRFIGDGKDTHLSELKGKPTILEFWATWCGPCHRVQAELALITAQFGDKINIVGVSDETAAIVRTHLAKYPAKYAMAVDEVGQSRAGYVIESIPLIVILDAEHNVAAVISGANKGALIEAKLKNLVGP